MKINFKITHNGKSVFIPIEKDSLEFQYGYCPIYFQVEDFYYSGVIDADYRTVVPFVCEESEEDFSVTTIFKNDKAIYGVKNREFYLIDLKKVQFKKQEDCIIPIQYEMKFDAYDDLDDTKALLLQNQEFFLYDVSLGKPLSFPFHYMERKDNDIWSYLYVVPKIEAPTSVLCCKMDFNGKIDHHVWINNISAWYNDASFASQDTLVDETVKIFQKLTNENANGYRIMH